uniref:Ribonuclease A-domain domain-containing protein n=1 Tax=Coturnix japonica TaxID=93934 RepID=A0A8C2TQ17_COTJA
MAVRFLWWTAVLLLALIVSVCHGQQRYLNFLNRHVDFPRTPSVNYNQYCNVMMMRRGMGTPGACKIFNTFVHAPDTSLNTLCINQPNEALPITRQQFPVTTCRVIRHFPTCMYRGRPFNHRVQVGCWGRLPGHLENTFP